MPNKTESENNKKKPSNLNPTKIIDKNCKIDLHEKYSQGKMKRKK